jgi:hypothetical protein
MGALLIVSVVVGFVCNAIAPTRSSGFSGILVLPLFFDLAIHISCMGLFMAILIYESESALTTSYSGDLGLPTFGVGSRLLLAAFVCRLVSHPIVFLGFLAACLVLALLPLTLVICCCIGAFSRSSSSSDTTRTYQVDKHNHRPVVFGEIREVHLREGKDGELYARVKRTYFYITTL